MDTIRNSMMEGLFSKENRMLVTGANGMVGHYVENIFKDMDLVLTDINHCNVTLDVTNPKEVQEAFLSFKPNVVLHLAAATDVDRCERDQDYAFHINIDGTRLVAEACKKHHATLIYVSTGAIFDGLSEKPYSEDDLPNPVTAYGKSKWEGEKCVSQLLDKYFIVRAGWMMGGGKKDKKFVGKIAQKILNGEKHFKIVNDKYGSPTYAKDLVLTIRHILNREPYGIYHAVNGFGCTRYDVALEMKSILKAHDVEIEPVGSDEFQLDANRAKSEELLNQKLMSRGAMRPWKEALRDYLLNDFLKDVLV